MYFLKRKYYMYCGSYLLSAESAMLEHTEKWVKKEVYDWKAVQKYRTVIQRHEIIPYFCE